MISAWDIYWVMQLDSIGCAFGVAAGVSLAVGVGSAIGCAFNRDMQRIWDDSPNNKQFKEYGAKSAACSSVMKKALPLGVALCIANAFIPSTKTAAAMVVLPAIANNQTIQREAGDLYGIAKDALRNLAAPKQEARK